MHADLVGRVARQVEDRMGPEVGALFANCFANTLSTTMTTMSDGTTFMITGDIPAMWLRDSTAQLTPYLHFVGEDAALADTVASVSRRQLEYVLVDPYANAFNRAPDGAGHADDVTAMDPWVWERKYEIDSLCYPIRLAYDLWERTGRTDHLARFAEVATTAIDLWTVEQDHETASPYRFERPDPLLPSDTLVRDGRGPVTVRTGLTWSAFRPSDDATTLGYNIPGNAFAVAELRHVAVLASAVFADDELARRATALADEIDAAIRSSGIVDHPDHGVVLAYEVDGTGNVLLMDDANVPSLLALPMLGWCDRDDPLYRRTRAAVLSPTNPYWFRGAIGSGIGSPHTPGRNVWPIALAVQGLTATDPDERAGLLRQLCTTHAGTQLMHESFDVDDPNEYTRPWFSWANAMFCEFVLDLAGLRTAATPVPEPERSAR
ncbi:MULTISPECIES: glycoside hydrolase family 125 protein [unclassified Curtobacterium]|uniref:glycoside hydrolase family 125 protein n=1 Tax=unclassified Curtobacterium TaxID=257496 RepID=UPI000D94E487|nr:MULTISPECIES: glycoside hydrolase family 125 protein [unclassified Curtobacterium]PYY49682.1 metal-independent alpha-mannosidase [Curtobacterium sp. MCBD17_023]PZE95231.1 metal-independent alpha-mannosidase [Curtobacterium sp. MCBD17_008]